MSIEIIKVPDIGGAEDVEVIEVCVAVGDLVAAEDSLVVLESDKASMEVPSPVAGKVVDINVSESDTVSEGDTVLSLELEVGNNIEQVDSKPELEVADPSPVPAPEDSSKSIAKDPAEQADSPEMRIEKIKVPDLGGAEAVDVIEISISVGDVIAESDSLIVVESDKASMEIPAPFAGKVLAFSVSEGGQVTEGDEILTMEVAAPGSNESPAEAIPSPAESEPALKPGIESTPVSIGSATSDSAEKIDPVGTFVGDSVYAGPAVRKMARELGVSLGKISGTGPKGRVIKEDVHSFVKSVMGNGASPATTGAGIPAIPAVDFSKFGEIELQPLSKMHKLTIANMHRNWLNVPHVTQFDNADITDLEEFRTELKKEAEVRGVKLTPMPFLLKACAVALREHPKFNASLHPDGEQMVFKQYIHIGIAVDTPAGLVVPVIRDVDNKSLWDLAVEIVELADKAKNRKLSPVDMQGACFTISSLGNIGGAGFTPIVNAPEVAILGVSKAAIQPVWNGSDFIPRKMLPLSLSYDHRAVNGADGGRFFSFLTGLLSDVRRLIL